MDKLQIQRMETVGAHWYLIRFTGERVPFLSFVSALSSERHGAYWAQSAFKNKGGWCVERSTLMRYKDRFNNLEMKIGLAERYAARVRQGKVS